MEIRSARITEPDVAMPIQNECRKILATAASDVTFAVWVDICGTAALS